MLTTIRDRSTGWLAWGIAALIIIPMAFWGIGDYASTEADPTLIEIGDQTISQNQFQAQLSSEQQRQRQAMGEQVNDTLLNSVFFKQNVLDQMINRSLIDQISEDQNYQISDQQLADLIKQNPIFQVDGKFDPAAYERYVVSSRYSKTQFEDAIRNDNRVSQVLSGFQESALVLPEEIRTLLEIQAEKRTFDLVAVKQQDYIETVQVSEQEIESYYTENQDNFMEPEKVSLSYLELDVNQLLNEVDVNEDELLAIYEQNVESFISIETRDTRHILLSTNGDNDDEQLAKAEGLVADLRGGGDFAELAEANSEDPGSANNGGDLGSVERGVMVEEFEEATFALEEGAISDPVKSQFGYHIIQVQKINPSEQQSFEDVRFDLEQEERQRLAEETLLDRVELLRDFAYEQPDNLDSAAEELSLEIKTTELFDQNSGIGIASSVAVRNAAFSEAVMFDNLNSEPIEVSEGNYVVVRKLERQETRPRELADVSDQIKASLIDQKATEAASAAGEQLSQQANADWQSLLSAVEESEVLELATHTVSLADQERTVDTTVIAQVTNAQMQEDTPTVFTVNGGNGDFYIVRLTDIEAGDLDSISEQIKDSTRRLIEQRNGQSLAGAYLESLRTNLVPEVDVSSL
ncbi:MAG: SurA N-terminal domain-containing protein [Acidiferrobacterales bacterium]|nr:SurA N-terminal domain-containing protein [Acidiferrobacterales bacterium]